MQQNPAQCVARQQCCHVERVQFSLVQGRAWHTSQFKDALLFYKEALVGSDTGSVYRSHGLTYMMYSLRVCYRCGIAAVS
jgi:hypothetical protein